MAERFARILQRFRTRRGLTKSDLAEALGASRMSVTAWEAGTRVPRDRARLLDIAQVLQLSPDEADQLIAAARHVPEAVAADEPPPPKPTSHRHPPLPQPPTRLIGRAAARGDLLARLRQPDCRLLTLVGPPGVGKTTLALHVAADLASDPAAFVDGVVFVPLAAVQESALALMAIAQALAVCEVGRQAPLATLSAVLYDQHTLLVLDNLEQVLDLAPYLAELLNRCPALTILATSRAPLNLRAEQQVPLLPLVVPDLAQLPDSATLAQTPAVALFLARVRAVMPAFALSAANHVAVAALCVRLDGLPLALELVARHVTILAPAQILAQLDQHLSLLADGPRDLPARHQSLRAAIDWSYALLPVSAQTLLCRLAVFVGGCTFDAAAQVVLMPGLSPLDVRAGLRTLVDQSLLHIDAAEADAWRYSMLETVRAFALERLRERGELALLQHALSAYCVDLAEQAEEALRGPQQAAWLTRLHAEQANLRAALDQLHTASDVLGLARLSVALGRFWSLAGTFQEGRQWLECALTAAPALPPALVARALTRLGWLMVRQSDYERARQTLAASVARWRAVGERAGLAQALSNLSVALLELGAHAAATAALDECIALRRAEGDQPGLIDALTNRGTLALLHDALEHARSAYAESLALSRAAGSPSQVAIALNNLAWVLIVAGACGAADTLLQESLALSVAIGLRRNQSNVLNNLGVVALDQGDSAQARHWLVASLRLHHTLGDQLGVAENLTALAAVAAQQRQPQASDLCAAAGALRAALGVPPASDQERVYGRYLAQLSHSAAVVPVADLIAAILAEPL